MYTRWTLTDNRAGVVVWTHTDTWITHAHRHTAECIEEDPGATFPDFGTVVFSNCQASDGSGELWDADASSLPADWTTADYPVARGRTDSGDSDRESSLAVTWTGTPAALLAFQGQEANAITDSLGPDWASSGIVPKAGVDWLATATEPLGEESPITVSSYRWNGTSWSEQGSVALPSVDVGNFFGPPDNSGELTAESLTGAQAPDFTLNTEGADTNWFSVISDLDHKWQAVPFDYGEGPTISIDAKGVTGGLVEAETNSCGCATGVETYTYYKYSGKTFVPTSPPGPAPTCTTQSFDALVAQSIPAADGSFVFSKVACADGWALGTGTDTFSPVNSEGGIALYQQEGGGVD